jgi:hypothetical protein
LGMFERNVGDFEMETVKRERERERRGESV